MTLNSIDTLFSLNVTSLSLTADGSDILFSMSLTAVGTDILFILHGTSVSLTADGTDILFILHGTYILFILWVW